MKSFSVNVSFFYWKWRKIYNSPKEGGFRNGLLRNSSIMFCDDISFQKTNRSFSWMNLRRFYLKFGPQHDSWHFQEKPLSVEAYNKRTCSPITDVRRYNSSGNMQLLSALKVNHNNWLSQIREASFPMQIV